MPKRFIIFLRMALIIIPLCFGGVAPVSAKMKSLAETMEPYRDNPQYQEYLKFFKEVFQKMQENYYHEVTTENFNKFLYIFNTRIYGQMLASRKSSDYIRWRSAAYLVDYIKDPKDIFSAFMPPKPAKAYEETVLGKEADIGEGIELGIYGEPVKAGYKVTRLEIRSDAYEQGLREGDTLLKIDTLALAGLENEAIQKMLKIPDGATVNVTYFDLDIESENTLEVLAKEFFKQYVFLIPVDVPDIYCIQIQRFNRTTGEDVERFMQEILARDEDPGLIIDLRGNPGGPPLAAREISGFFLEPKAEFAYFQKRNKPKASLYVPEFPETFHFKGDMVILVNKGSGSASELFSGILQGNERATVMGTNTAGQVFLKSMFYFDDESMVLLVTARGFHPNGTVFSYDGVAPDEHVEDQGINLIRYAAEYLADRRERAMNHELAETR